MPEGADGDDGEIFRRDFAALTAVKSAWKKLAADLMAGNEACTSAG